MKLFWENKSLILFYKVSQQTVFDWIKAWHTQRICFLFRSAAWATNFLPSSEWRQSEHQTTAESQSEGRQRGSELPIPSDWGITFPLSGKILFCSENIWQHWTSLASKIFDFSLSYLIAYVCVISLSLLQRFLFIK